MIELNKKVKEAVARNIRKYREIAYPGNGGATKCAKALDVSLQQWSLWENGHRAPTAHNLKRIACALNVSTAVLCDVAAEGTMMRLVSCPKNDAAPSDWHGVIWYCPMRFNANAPHHPTGCFLLPFWHDK